MYLSLDGSATIYVNSSIAALNALRGTSFDTRPRARIDRDAVRQYFTTPVDARHARHHVPPPRPPVSCTSASRPTTCGSWVRAAPFAWSSYSLARPGRSRRLQAGGRGQAGRGARTEDADWTGDELVAFRIHVPSVVEYHNAGPANLRRGNIVVWEQSLGDRLRGAPLELEVRMQPQSILYRTLILFASMFAAVAVLFGVVIWRIVRAGQKKGG